MDELTFTKNLALRAGEIITRNFAKTEKGKTIKANTTPVTETDLTVSRLVIDAVKKNFPDHAVLDEEFQNEDNNAEYVWICDPIDGTIPFAHAIPTSMFSLALSKNKEVILGVIYDPYQKRLLYSMKNKPSFMNGKKIQVNKNRFDTGETVFIIPHWLDNFDYNYFFNYFKKREMSVMSVESYVYLCMLIANGAVTAALLPIANPWDRAAGELIVKKCRRNLHRS